MIVGYHPIFAWPEWTVWEFIEKYQLPYPSLYIELGHMWRRNWPWRTSHAPDLGAEPAESVPKDWYPILF